MLKKYLALFLCLALLFVSLSACAEKVTLGTISVNGEFTLQCGLPEGYTVKPLLINHDQLVAVLSTEDVNKPAMMLSVAFDESYYDVDRLNDLDDEALSLLESTYTIMDPTVDISYGETAHGTRLLIAKQLDEEENYIDFLTIYKGYFVEFVMVASEESEDKTLTEEDLQLCIDFLSDLDFIQPDASLDLSGKTYSAVLGAYDADTQSLEVILKEPVTLTDEEVKSLTEGDTLLLGREPVVIETVTEDEADYVINDEIILHLHDAGTYGASLYEHAYMREIAVLKLRVEPDHVSFLDSVDPVTGYTLDEPAQISHETFMTMLQDGSGDSIGFDADNVRVTFDAQGQLCEIERFYVPWQ